MKASVFRNFNVVVEDKSLLAISKEIMQGKYKSEVEEVRQLFASGNKAGADDLKKKLPGFTPSATFSGGRKAVHVSFYSQCIVLDLDNLTPDQLEDAFYKHTRTSRNRLQSISRLLSISIKHFD